VDIKYMIVGLLIAALIGWTIVDGIETGQRGGRIYEDNTPTLGPHHWNPPITGSVFCIPTQSPTQMFCWNWCVSIDIRT